MGLLANLIEENKMNVLDKETLWRENHNLTFKKIELVDGNFGKQWRIETIDTSKDNEEGFVFFSDKVKSRNAILQGLADHIESTGTPYPGIALDGKVTKEKTMLQAATISYKFREWAETYQ